MAPGTEPCASQLIPACLTLSCKTAQVAPCIAGTNCAEAVNFGPPDWLPWGHFVQEKYTRDGKAATLSNDALLVALCRAAPLVQVSCEKPGTQCKKKLVSRRNSTGQACC